MTTARSATPDTIADCLAAAAARLASRSATPRLDAELLLAEVLGTARSHLHAWPERGVAATHHAAFFELIARRAAGTPVAYLTGRREFWSLTLAVDAHTLIPRPDTERLVELALERLPAAAPQRIADIGTGSGAIALALAHERPQSRVIATDLSAAALAVARRNAHTLGLTNVEFRHGDGLAPLGDEHLDMICANPPYLAADDPHLRDGDLTAEPRSALVAGPTGLELIERLAHGARHRLRAGGWLLLEHGHTQGETVAALLAALDYRAVETAHDHAGLPRVTLGRSA